MQMGKTEEYHRKRYGNEIKTAYFETKKEMV
jgi:hypothetical protein